MSIKAECSGCGEDCSNSYCTFEGEPYHANCLPTRKGKKHAAMFFVSDVMECVDYVEYQADKYSDPEEFKKAVVNKMGC